jgi:hypothetical protein
MSTPDLNLVSGAARRREHVIITKWGIDWPWKRRGHETGRRDRRRDRGALLLAGAAVLLAADATAMGIVSWHAQYAFVYGAKHQHAASALEALGLDAGAVIFALLALALARLRRRAVIERVLVVACAGGSCGMNLLAADLGSPRSVAVYVMPPVLFAAMSDRLVAVVRRAAMGTAEDGPQRSAWRTVGLALLYVLRFTVAAPSTAKGARRALLNATPLPVLAASQPLTMGTGNDRGQQSGGLCSRCGNWFTSTFCPDCGHSSGAGDSGERPGWEPPRAGTKTARFLALVAERYGPLAGLDLGKVSRVAGELAPQVGLHPGSARTALRAAVLAAQAGGAE